MKINRLREKLKKRPQGNQIKMRMMKTKMKKIKVDRKEVDHKINSKMIINKIKINLEGKVQLTKSRKKMYKKTKI